VLEALEAGEHDAAVTLAEAAVAESPDPDLLRLLGGLYYVDDRIADSRRCFEQAFALLRSAGRLCEAARCAIDVSNMYGTEQPAIANGWVAHARRLLEQVGPCVEWGYLELAVIACDRPDIDELIASADRAMAIATEFGDADLETLALADGGLGLVSSGQLGDGFRRIDAALASVSTGAVGPVAAGLSYCAMLAACDRAGDVRRVEQWRSAIDAIPNRTLTKPRALHTHCRMTYGSVLLSAGQWDEAERLLVEALGDPDSPSVTHRALTSSHLARLRLEQGRLAEAEDLLAPFEDQRVSTLPLARLHARRGQRDLAAAVLHRAVDELVGDALRVAPLLTLTIEVELDRGDVAAAQQALDRLSRLAATVDGDHLTGDVARGRARLALATGDRDRALADLQEATRWFAAADRQVQLAEVRLDLAELLAADATDDRTASAVAEARAAHACFDRLGAVNGRDRAAELLRRLGGSPPRPSGDPARIVGELTQRERDVLALIAEGLTNPQIAERLYISPKTAEHHVGRLLAKLGVRNRAEAAVLYERARLVTHD
jgi:DNA-binding CsgD family transcriptional regulator